MIKALDKDMNRSRDVKGPELIRPSDQELTMKDSNSQTGTISKHSLSELHCGNYESPLTGLGEQQVVVSHPMGSDSPDHKPMVAKGPTKDQAHFGGKGSREPKGAGRSVAKEMMSAEKHKSKY